MGEPSSGVDLDHQGGGVTIDDKPGETIVLSVNNSVASGVTASKYRLASLDRGIETLRPPRLIDGDRPTMMEYPNANG